MLECLLRRRYDPAELFASHPPRLRRVAGLGYEWGTSDGN